MDMMKCWAEGQGVQSGLTSRIRSSSANKKIYVHFVKCAVINLIFLLFFLKRCSEIRVRSHFVTTMHFLSFFSVVIYE